VERRWLLKPLEIKVNNVFHLSHKASRIEPNSYGASFTRAEAMRRRLYCCAATTRVYPFNHYFLVAGVDKAEGIFQDVAPSHLS